jgi:hypothetical protein
VRELNQQKQRGAQLSTQLYKVKQIVKRVTIEGEHTCLMLLKQDLSMTNHEPLCLEILPIMNAPYQSQTLNIPLASIRIVHIYRYLFQHKALRIVTDKQDEYIFDFQKTKYCQRVFNLLMGLQDQSEAAKHPAETVSTTPLCPDATSNLRLKLDYYQDAWRRGLLSNGDYLLYLNFAAHRSFNDPSQYPIFPWVVQDYKFEYLDLGKDMTFRDFSKPVGALSSEKLETFKSKYFEIVNKQSLSEGGVAHILYPQTVQNLEQQQAEGAGNVKNIGVFKGNNSEKPYMYLSHYSTPGIVFYYLIRQVPSFILKIQNEQVDVPHDKIFHDINISW